MKLSMTLLLPLVCLIPLHGCAKKDQESVVLDNGTAAFPPDVARAIKAACDQEVPGGIQSTAISKEECYLFIAGASNQESSWNLNMRPEAWGQVNNPARGLTQSRDTDATFVGLDVCRGHLDSDPVCNLRVGLRNLTIRANTLDAGISVHLGSPNPGAKPGYLATIKRVWDRADVRSALGITGTVRDWETVRWVNLR